MATETFAISYAPVPGFPAGSAVASVAVAIVGSNPANNQNQTVAPGTASVVFNNVAADSYTYSISAQDASTPPNVFGTSVTGTFTVAAATTVTLNLPSAATVTQS